MRIISELAKTVKRTGHLEQDVHAFFEIHGYNNVAEHTAQVAENAIMLAARFGISPELPVTAAHVHDLGWVLDEVQVIPAAVEAGIDIVDEERQYPGLLHQRLSRVMAREIFEIDNRAVLSAVECHTTLKAGASDIDLLLLVADKLCWKAQDSETILEGIWRGLEKSLAHAALSYIEFCVSGKNPAMIIHPWTRAAYEDLKLRCI